MNILTDEEIKAIDPDGLAEGFARAIESAVLEKLKAQSVKSPDNGKWNTGIASDGRVFLQSDDFNHDVRLYVNGDFDGNTTDYADRLAAFMNSHPLPPDDVVRDAERYRWLIDNSYDRDGFLQFQVWKHSWEPHSQTGIPIEWKCRVRGPAIDAAIDAAMKEMK